MNDELLQSDPAAIFGCALSLWQECKKQFESDEHLNLSECYNGIDEFMRVVMRVAIRFEDWACLHIDFNELDDVWPYKMEDRFGTACLSSILPTRLNEFRDTHCLRTALSLHLPVRFDTNLPLPVGETAANPLVGSEFPTFQIRTMRESRDGERRELLTSNDDPFDERFRTPFFSLYGVSVNGFLEHIADRKTYIEAVQLARKLAPGIQFPDTPHVSSNSVAK